MTDEIPQQQDHSSPHSTENVTESRYSTRIHSRGRFSRAIQNERSTSPPEDETQPTPSTDTNTPNQANPQRAIRGPGPARIGAQNTATRPRNTAARSANRATSTSQNQQTSDTLPQVVIKSFDPVYIVTPDEKECIICRNRLIDPCPTCRNKGSDTRCSVARGLCGHRFHLHCINNYVSAIHSTPACCPSCMAPWAIESVF